MEINRSSYGIHPSVELREMFSHQPYQCQHPEKAEIIVLGNDANYAPDLSSHPFFANILDYHQDGIAFWQREGVHHPFLLDEYPFRKNMGGVPYHRKFARMGFDPEAASQFSFVELLDVPTIGSTGQDRGAFYRLLSKQHLDWLESVLLDDRRKFVLLNATLQREIHTIHRKLGAMKGLSELLKLSHEREREVSYLDTTFYKGMSFSASISNSDIDSLGARIRAFQENGH